jgi:hypothetical protein
MSDKIFRYSPVRFGQLEVDANGAFVFYADVAPLEARIEELVSKRKRLLNLVCGNCGRAMPPDGDCFGCSYDLSIGIINGLKQRITEQAAEIERLKKAWEDQKEIYDRVFDSREEALKRIDEQAAEIERLNKLCAELIGSNMKREVE